MVTKTEESDEQRGITVGKQKTGDKENNRWKQEGCEKTIQDAKTGTREVKRKAACNVRTLCDECAPLSGD